MNRTFTRGHKLRISDQTLESKDSRCEDSKESSDESSDDDDDEDEDEENSTDRDAEDTEEEFLNNRREWEALARYLKSQRAYIERNSPRSFYKTSGAKKEKKDKMTQKNLTSPLPSIWKPPVYKEISTAPNFKVIKSKEMYSKEKSKEMNSKEKSRGEKNKERELEDVMLRYITKLQTGSQEYRNENKKPCSHKPTPAEKMKKLCSKHRKQAELKSKKDRCDTHTCIDMALPNMPAYVPQMENIRRQDIRRKDVNLQSQPPVGSYREFLCKRPESEERGKVREKLVYVVEEEAGKNVAKMETDLFSVNEILAIKKDLMELSEFAQKLKKLKEMRKKSEKEKSSETECQCKPLTELLKDVNKRMETLEARQEELERGIQKGRETETETKKTDDTKTSSISPPIKAVKPEPSAVKSDSSFEKSEMTNLSRERGGAFSKNLEIVNELLDIKSQLQKLERKRMSKEFSPEIGPAGPSKMRPKDQAVNVFSSKTYILTTDTYNKKKNKKDIPTEAKCSAFGPSMIEKTSASLERQQMKDNVVDWLKNISTPENPNSNLKIYVASKNPIESLNTQEENWGVRTPFKEKNSHQTLQGEDFENQEPQTNRAKDIVRHEKNQTGSKISRELSTRLNGNEGHMVSEELFGRKKLKEKMTENESTEIRPTRLLPQKPEKPFKKPIKTASNSSVPSAVNVKEQVQRFRNSGHAPRRSYAVKPTRSKSLQEFTSTSCLSKDEKTVLNTSRKKLEERCAGKERNENEYDHAQEELSRFLKHIREMSPNHSQLVASVNLEERRTSVSQERGKSPDYSLPLFPFPIPPPELVKFLNFCEKEERSDQINKEKWCRRETCEHKPKKINKANDKFKSCVNKCCRKKTRVKCSRNHCCNKKAKRAASRSSRCCPRKESKPPCGCRMCCKKEVKKCHKTAPKNTCSDTSPSSTEREKAEGTISENQTSSECFRKEKDCRCSSRKPRPKNTCHRKTKKSQHEKEQKHHSPCQEPTSFEETLKTEEESECQEKEERPTSETSESCKKQVDEKPKKSSLKINGYHKPKNQSQPFHEDPCYIASLWKSLRKLYPRFSTLQLMSWLRLYCQEEKRTKGRRDETARFRDSLCGEKQKEHECPNCQYKYQPHRSQCCKSYRMSAFHQRWPGFNPSSEISENSITEAETRSSTTNTETDFMFPYRKPNLYYAYQAMNEEGQSEESKKKKNSKRKKEKKENKENKEKKEKKTTSSDENSKDEKKTCQCNRCGNLHPKKGKNSNNNNSSGKQESEGKPDTESKTLSKKDSNTPKKSIFSRLGDVRHLRVCEGKLKCPKLKFSRSKASCKCKGEPKCDCEARDTSSKAKDDGKKNAAGRTETSCPCETKLMELENRITFLEKEKKGRRHRSEEDANHQQENGCDEEKRKNKSKKKKKEKRENSEESESGNEEECKKKKKKKKKKKEKEKQENSGESESGNEEECKKKKKKKKKKKEKEKQENSGESESANGEECKRKKKKKKKKREKEEKSEESGDSGEECKKKKKKKEKQENSGDSESANGEECKRKKKKKKRKREKEEKSEESPESGKESKKKKKKDKEENEEHLKCHCKAERGKKKNKNDNTIRSQSSDERQETEAYYCKCVSQSFNREQITEQTTTATPSEKASFRQTLRKKKQEVLEKLSSFSSLWKNIRGRRKSDEELLDDPSRSSEVPRTKFIRHIEDEPNVIWKQKKHKKMKKDKKIKQRQTPKSKSGIKRHRY